MPIIDLYGHEGLRQRLSASIESNTLPASLLLHGAAGVGKQRLALWLAQRLLCTGRTPPCDECTSCRYVRDLTHPDLHWVFPRPRLKDAEPDADQVRDDYAEASAERAAAGGLYAPPSGSEAIYVATVRALVRRAAISPAMGSRKVFIVGDAERMVPQEGADMAANAFLKLLEEPPADTTIVLTTSEPGALLPTIRSRVIAVRVPLVTDESVKRFLADPVVRGALGKGRASGDPERVRVAAGAPGRLLSGETSARATLAARRILDAATGDSSGQRYAAALAQGAASARGAFSETLEAVVELLGERARDALHRDDQAAAASASRAVSCVLDAQSHTTGNVSPQLLAAKLVRDLSATLR